MDLQSSRRDVVAIEQGQWVDDLPDMGDLRVKSRGLDNSDWCKLMARLVAAVPREKRRGNNIDTDVMDKIISQCLYETTVQDWDNIFDVADKATQKKVPYSKELALDLCTNPERRDYRNAFLNAATIVSQSTVISEEVVKNS